MADIEKKTIEERIDKNKDNIRDYMEIRDFLFEDENQTKNIKDLGEYLNNIGDSGYNEIKQTLQSIMDDPEIIKMFEGIEEKVKKNENLTDDEMGVLYINAVLYGKGNGFINVGEFDLSLPIEKICNGYLLAYIQKRYNNYNYNPNKEKGDRKPTVENTKKEEERYRNPNVPNPFPEEIDEEEKVENEYNGLPVIPLIRGNEYVHAHFNKIIKWAEANGYLMEAERESKERNEFRTHVEYDETGEGKVVYDKEYKSYVEYDKLLIIFGKYCEVINKKHEELVKKAGYWDLDEFAEEMKYIDGIQEYLKSKYPDLDETMERVKPYFKEMEENKKKYFGGKTEEEVEKAGKEFGEYKKYEQEKIEEYGITEETIKSLCEIPKDEKELEAYLKNLNAYILYQNETEGKKREYGENIDKYLGYIKGIQAIRAKYGEKELESDLEMIKNYMDDLESSGKMYKPKGQEVGQVPGALTIFDKFNKYSELMGANPELSKDLKNMKTINEVLSDPTGDDFWITDVKNDKQKEKKKQEERDRRRNNWYEKYPVRYELLSTGASIWNTFINFTVGTGTSLGAMICGMILGKEHYQSSLQRKERWDSSLTIGVTREQQEGIYDSETGKITLNWKNGPYMVASSVTNMYLLILGGDAAGKGVSKIFSNMGMEAVGKAGLFSMSFITQAGQSYTEAMNAGLEGNGAFIYSMLTATAQSSLELVSPNEVLLGKGTGVGKEMVRALCKGGNKGGIKLAGKYFLKTMFREMGEEILQEEMQLAAGNLINDFYNGTWNTNFESDWGYKNFLATAMITAMTTGVATGISSGGTTMQIMRGKRGSLINKIFTTEGLYEDVMKVLENAIKGEQKIPDVKVEQLEELKKTLSNIHDNPSIIQGQNENQGNKSEDYENTENTEDFNNGGEMFEKEYEEAEDSENTEDSNNSNGMSETAYEETADKEKISEDSKCTNTTDNQSTGIENDKQRQEEKSIQSTINDMTPEQQEIIKIMENKKGNLDPDDIATIKKMNLNEQQVANIKAIVDLGIIIRDVLEIWEVKDIILTPEQINNINILKRLGIENINRYDLEFTQDEIKNIEKVLNLCYEVENFIFLRRIANITETEMNNIITVAKNIKNKIKATDLIKIMESTPEQINNVIIMNNLGFIIHGEIIDDIIGLSQDEIENIARIKHLGIIVTTLDIDKIKDLKLTENQIDIIDTIYSLGIDNINVNNLLEFINLTPYEISILKIDSENIDEGYNHSKEEKEANYKYKKGTTIENIQKYIQNTISENRDISTKEVVREIRPFIVTMTINERLKIINEIKESVKKFNTVRKYLDFEKGPYKTPKQLLCAVRGITDQKLITAIKDNITVKQHGIGFMFFVGDEKSYQIIYDRSTEDSGKRSGGFNTHDSEIEELKGTFSVVNGEDPNNNENNYENGTQNHEGQHNRNTEFMKDKNGSPISRAKDEITAFLRDGRGIFKVEKRDSTIYQILTKPKKKGGLYQYGLKGNDRENHKKQVKELCTYANNLIELTKESKTGLTRDNVISMLVDTDYHNRGKLHSIIMKTVENQNNSSIEQIKNLKQEFKTKIGELAVNNRLINNLINFWNSIFQNNRIKLEEFRWAGTAEKKTVINDIENCNSLEEIKHVLDNPKYSHIGWGPNNLGGIEVSQIIDEVIAGKQLINNIPTELRQCIQDIYKKSENSGIVQENGQKNIDQKSEESNKPKEKQKKRNQNYFDGQSHEFDVTQDQAIENSQYMDNILESINEGNMVNELDNLRKRISEQHHEATGENIELTDEQLLSILDAHEQDGKLGELTLGQLRQKVKVLDDTITNPKVRRFLLEAGFCGQEGIERQEKQQGVVHFEKILDKSKTFELPLKDHVCEYIRIVKEGEYPDRQKYSYKNGKLTEDPNGCYIKLNEGDITPEEGRECFLRGLKISSELMNGQKNRAVLSSGSLFLNIESYGKLGGDIDIATDVTAFNNVALQRGSDGLTTLERFQRDGKIRDLIFTKIDHSVIDIKNMSEHEITELIERGDIRVEFNIPDAKGNTINCEFFPEPEGYGLIQLGTPRADGGLLSYEIEGNLIKTVSPELAAMSYMINLAHEFENNSLDAWNKTKEKAKDKGKRNIPKLKDSVRMNNFFQYLESANIRTVSDMINYIDRTIANYEQQHGKKIEIEVTEGDKKVKKTIDMSAYLRKGLDKLLDVKKLLQDVEIDYQKTLGNSRIKALRGTETKLSFNQFMNETLKIKEELFNLKDIEKTPQKRDEIMREIYNLQKMVNINDPKSFSYYYEIYQLKTNFLYKVFGKNN